MDKIPRRFFTTKFEEWKEKGYEIKSFRRKNIDLSLMPDYYKEQLLNTERSIEKDYLINHLLINDVAYLMEDEDRAQLIPKESLVRIIDFN